ncbi:SLC13 family permease [Alkalimonas sp.]|uniref:SLC13 family permease n=1 Tax=Alkalimonas sp. TaxID=1872453 RepID=UPI00263B0C6A|nr:SLC13 family permease [Alkalimonas sp.]MCC5826806.1 transporter [Alkalimonas sp.]
MHLLRHLLSRVTEDLLLLVLLLALPLLLWFTPSSPAALLHLVDWPTITALAALMLLSRGLEDSGYLARFAAWLLRQEHSQRQLAVVLVAFAALLSAVITNDVALFVLVPICLSLARLSGLPVGRLIIFLALAVNAGSSISPIGNPQNLLLWQASGLSFLQFLLMMLPLALLLTLLLMVLSYLAFPASRLLLPASSSQPRQDKQLFRWSLLGYLPVIIAIELGLAPAAAVLVAFGYWFRAKAVVLGIDWWLLLIFALMFIDLGLLAQLPLMQQLATASLELPGGAFTAGAVLSQLLSNVPAAIFLQNFTDDWRALSWGVSVGGFGLAIGSLANLIALRLAKHPGLWREFHAWSVPIFFVSALVGALLLASTNGCCVW